jgi:DNA-binding CsgD family transcriptional regulator
MDPGDLRDWDNRDTQRSPEESGSPDGAPIRSVASGWSGLTATERRIPRMAGDGLMNAEIGQELFVSRHTVDYHLRRIFVKLDVHSRVPLARHAAEHGEDAD